MELEIAGLEIDKALIDYLLAPKQTGYDIPKTVIYAALLVLAVYSIYKTLKKLRVSIDKRLAIAVAPYVVLGGALRVLQDAAVVNSYLFVTPGIYVFVFGITFGVLALSLALQKRFGVPYYETAFTIGVLLLPFALAQLSFSNFYGGALVLLALLPWIVIFIPSRSKAEAWIMFKISKWPVENKIVTLVHLFDATTTAVSMSFFGYYEQHVLPTFFINIFGPFSFIFLKVVAIVAILVIMDRYSSPEDIEFKNYLKLVIGILGAATASRDFIGLLVGV